MEVEAGDVHFLRPRRNIQSIETTKDANLKSTVDFSRPSSLPKVGKGLALEASDHARIM
jgi:hypothetical protein